MCDALNIRTLLTTAMKKQHNLLPEPQVDAIVKHVLTMEIGMDFNFDDFVINDLHVPTDYPEDICVNDVNIYTGIQL